jgi:hypothetical protein
MHFGVANATSCIDARERRNSLQVAGRRQGKEMHPRAGSCGGIGAIQTHLRGTAFWCLTDAGFALSCDPQFVKLHASHYSDSQLVEEHLRPVQWYRARAAKVPRSKIGSPNLGGPFSF